MRSHAEHGNEGSPFMPRQNKQRGDPINGDSFVDIVACVVSIMIIMVVLEGMRVKNTPVGMSIPSTPALEELDRELAAEKSLRADVLKVVDKTKDLEKEAAARGMRRDYLATMVAAVEDEINNRREKLDQVRRDDFDRVGQLAESKRRLEQIDRAREQIEKQPAEPIMVESYPSPISRTVDGPEAHLLIENGRVLFVPLELLLDEFQSKAKRQVYQLRNQPELTDTVGPVRGFRLRYTLERYDVPMEVIRRTGQGGSYVRLRRWTLIPIARDLGEPVRLALKPDSDFRRELTKILPGRTTITIWVYPDGFEAFRQIRKELYDLGYSIAGRPLPPGTPIGGSPDGTKSASQ